MPSVESWQAFAGVGGVIIFLGSVVFGLQRLGFIGQKKQVPAPVPDSPRLGAIESKLGNVEREGQMAQGTLTDLAIRIGALEAEMPRPEALGRVHKRLDDLTASLSHVEGELKAANRTLHLIQEHLLNKT